MDQKYDKMKLILLKNHKSTNDKYLFTKYFRQPTIEMQINTVMLFICKGKFEVMKNKKH